MRDQIKGVKEDANFSDINRKGFSLPSSVKHYSKIALIIICITSFFHSCFNLLYYSTCFGHGNRFINFKTYKVSMQRHMLGFIMKM